MADEAALFAARAHDREQEYRQRRLTLELAAAGVPPASLDARVPAIGAREFAASIAGIDADAALAVVDAIHVHGHASAPLLDAVTVERLRDGLAPLFDACARLFAHTPSNRLLAQNQAQHVHNVLAKTDVADAVAVLPMLRAVVAGVLGYDFVLNAGAVAMSPDPGCSPQALHRDDSYYASLQRPHLPLVLTVAIALDDFTAANGATRVVPGSHTWPEGREPLAGEVVPCELPAGSMLVWDGAIFHAGGGNRTADRPRRTLTFNYARGWLRTQFNQYLSVPRERVLAMPAALQADLGYQPSAMGLGRCDAQPPLDYLERLQAAGGDGAQSGLGRD